MFEGVTDALKLNALFYAKNFYHYFPNMNWDKTSDSITFLARTLKKVLSKI
jgi:hypothetical protein